MGDFNNEKYPVGSLKPKAETGVLSFLAKYPNFNGSDVTIAILDSGVDPRAAGLQVCYSRAQLLYVAGFKLCNNSQILPNGERKVIERFDCSGCGDISTSTVVTATSDTITGLSGRTLKLSNYMKSNNVSAEYRLGLKNLMDLYPSRVRDKILADAKLKRWDESNKKALADIARDITDFEGKNSSEFG